jgi:GDP-4-dehydro-6-deoxy-D-mannose reductase
MKRVLITGITGMIGKHLAQLLLERGYQVAGFSRATSASRYNRGTEGFRFYQGDILDRKFLKAVWTDWKPEWVVHLAAQAYNGESWKAEDSTYLLNIQGARNVFDACLEYSPGARILPACSSAAYGLVPEGLLPIQEDHTPLQPMSPYGVTKASMEMMGRQFHLNYGMDIVLPRLFIHVGPDHPPVTALQNFARQLAAIQLEKQEAEIKVGNLESSRDFVDVRDGVRALLLLAEKGTSGAAYNICTGTAWTMQESLDLLIKISGLNVHVRTSPELFRPSDEKVLLGDPSKIRTLGWKPQIPFEQTLQDIYANWLQRLR